jgi:hypothetical protein
MRVKDFYTLRCSGQQYLRIFVRDGPELLGGLDIAMPAVFQSKRFASATIEFTTALMYQRLGCSEKAIQHYTAFISARKALLKTGGAANMRSAHRSMNQAGRGDAPYGGDLPSDNNSKREPAAPEREREVFNNAESENDTYLKLAEKNLAALQNKPSANNTDVEIRQFRLNELYTILHVIGNRERIEEVVRRNYRDEFTGNEPIGTTDYIRAKYNLERDIELPSELTEALHAQKRANTLLRQIDNRYLFLFHSHESKTREELAVATLMQDTREKDLQYSTHRDARREHMAAKILLERVYESKKNRDELISRASAGFSARHTEEIASAFNDVFGGIDYCKAPDYAAYYRAYSAAMRSLVKDTEAANPARTVTDQKKRALEDLVDLLSLPSEVYSHLAMLREEAGKADALVKKFSGAAKIDWKSMRLDLSVENFSLDDIKASMPAEETGCVYNAYDIETLGWVGSSRDPKGLRPEIFLAALCSEEKSFREDSLMLPSDAPEDTIQQIAAKYKDIVVGTQDIGTKLIETGLTHRRARYILAPDQFVLRRIVADIMFYKNPAMSGGNNHDAFDLPRSANPRRMLTENERVHYSEIEELANRPDNIFNPNPDNSGPRYVSQTWRQKWRLAANSRDFLNISKSYLGMLATDSKLETVGMLLDFFEDFGLGYGKIFHSYKEMELSALLGKEGDTGEAYKNARYCYEDNIAQLRIMSFFDRIMGRAADLLEMDSTTVFSDAKPSVAELFWDRDIFEKNGSIRRVEKKKPYEGVKIEDVKKNVLGLDADEEAKSGQQEFDFTKKPKVSNRIGIFRDCELYINTVLSESLEAIIAKNHRLSKLREAIRNCTDPFEAAMHQQLLDAILLEPAVDILRTHEGMMQPTAFGMKYRVDPVKAYNLMRTIATRMQAEVKRSSIVAYDGNLIAVQKSNGSNRTLPAHTYISDADVLSVGDGEFVYRLQKPGKEPIVASRAVGIPSVKRRHSQDYIFDGFQPNFIINLEHDFVLDCFDDPEHAAGLIDGTLQAIEDDTLPIAAYFMTIRPGHDLYDYSLPYRRTKRFKVIDLLDIKKAERKTFVAEERTDTEDIIFREIDPNRPESMQDIQPDKEFYTAWLKKASPKLAKLECAVKASLKK